MKREYLLHFFPFLKKEFRRLEIAEITNEEVFKELFGDEKIDLSKLKAVYEFQKTDVEKLVEEIRPKKKRNGKV